MDDTFPIRILKPLPIFGMTLIALATAFGVNGMLFPQHGRITFFSCLMSLFAIYSSLDIFEKTPVKIFVLIYVLEHVALCFILLLSDQSYYGAIIIPAAILDYVGFVYGAYYFYKQSA